MAKRTARGDGSVEINGHAHERRGPGRPRKRRPDDGRLVYQHSSALARAADHAGLMLLARLELDSPTLKRADQYARRSIHWGGIQSTMLHKNLPPPRLPPPRRVGDSTAQWIDNLERWTIAHALTRTLRGQDRCLKMSDALYRLAPVSTARPASDDGVGGHGAESAVEGGSDEWIQCELCCRWRVVPPKYGPVNRLPVDFRCSDAVWCAGAGQPACLLSQGSFEPKAWVVMERWMRDLSMKRWRLTFDDTIGFGLTATDTFTKGEIVTHGTPRAHQPHHRSHNLHQPPSSTIATPSQACRTLRRPRLGTRPRSAKKTGGLARHVVRARSSTGRVERAAIPLLRTGS